MSSTNLPLELVEEILTWLPAQSLLRFRCVSKPWKALIDSSNFTKSHLSRNLYSKCYIFSYRDTGLEVKLIDLSNHVFDSIECSNPLLFQSLKLPVPTPLGTRILGSCNGLIALGNLCLQEIILVNPSTREYQLLPPFGEEVRFLDVGFGYDCFTDEYKVVVKRIKTTGFELSICGSKSKTWRKIHRSYSNRDMDVFNYSVYGKYSHGALHWITASRHTNSSKINRIQIDAFDLVTEEFVYTKYNGEVFGYPVGVVNLEVLGDCLCLCCRRHYRGGVMDVWVMKKYGATESWGKLASLPWYTRPLALSTCGRHLLFQEYDCPKDRPNLRYLGWYDVEKESMEYFGSTTTTRPYHFALQAQSLVRLPENLPRHV